MLRTLLVPTLLVAALAGGAAAQVAPYFVDPEATEPLPQSFAEPLQYGAWEGPYDWHHQIVPDDPPPGHLELGHATLIVTGPHRGKVLLWNWDFVVGPAPDWEGPGEPPLINLPTTRSWLFDPEDPGTLQPVLTTLPDDIFCCGHSLLPDGRVFVAGGLQPGIPPAVAPTGCFLFDPLQAMDEEPGPWLPDEIHMALPRYYASSIPLLASHGGDALVFGGTASISINPGFPSLERWRPDASTLSFTVPAPLGGDFARAWEFYPRAYQLSDGRIFVAGDVQYAENQYFAGINTHPGEAFLITLPAHGDQDATIERATPPWEKQALTPAFPGPPTSGAASTYFDREYAPCVLMHRRPANGGSDRVLVFGGREGNDAIDAGYAFLHPHYRVRYHRSVQEFDLFGGPPSDTPGTWYDKEPLLQRRHFANATVLPTGTIFIDGGMWSGREQRSLHPLSPVHADPEVVHYDRPAVVPELYDPGVTRQGIGGSKWAAPAEHGVPGYGHDNTEEVPISPLFPITPRGYHHTSMLLPDGRVFVCGGEDFSHPGHLHPDTLPPEGGHAYAGSAHTGELYAPPYLFAGWRPKIARSPDVARFGARMRIRVESTKTTPVSFVLVRPGAITHHFSPDQRYIEVAATRHAGAFPGREDWNVMAPDASLAPPGYYMLFAVQESDGMRVPSTGVFLKLQ